MILIGLASACVALGIRVFCIDEAGLENALHQQGAEFVGSDGGAVDAVSYDRGFNYEKLTNALPYIMAGARFVAANDDQVITSENGLLPEAGPLVAAIMAATGKSPEIVGKPHAPIMQEALRRLGALPEETIIIGNYPACFSSFFN